MHVESSQISHVLAQQPTTTLASTQHLQITSTPADDLAEEDFADRVRGLVQATKSLTSLTICIPSMARLHPSNSLPKVLDVLHSIAMLHPHCSLSLVVHEAEQAWSALTILQRIVKLGLHLHSLELSRAFFPAEKLIRAAQACGLVRLTLDATQVFSSAPSFGYAVAGARAPPPSIPSLTSLTAQLHSEASPGLDVLLSCAARTLTHLNLSVSGDVGVAMQDRAFPHLARLSVNEALLPEMADARMPLLEELVVPALVKAESCEMLQGCLQSWPCLRDVRVSKVVAGDASDALVRLSEHRSVRVMIGELAINDPARVSPAALAISEHLVNAGPPIAAKEWPLGFGERQYPRLKSIVLKVHEGGSHEAFIALLDAPNLEGAPNVSVIKSKSRKGGKR